MNGVTVHLCMWLYLISSAMNDDVNIVIVYIYRERYFSHIDISTWRHLFKEMEIDK